VRTSTIIIIVAITYAVGFFIAWSYTPRLIGYGCAGAGGPLYANEEDHFPTCAKIERNGL